jgi:hypothetical protein
MNPIYRWGTVIAIYISYYEILVGVDSKSVEFQGNSANILGSKIHQIEDVFYSYAGYVGDEKFQVSYWIEQAYEKDRTIEDITRVFEELVKAPLAESLARFQMDSERDFQKFLKSGDSVLEVCFLCFEYDRPNKEKNVLKTPILSILKFGLKHPILSISLNVSHFYYRGSAFSTGIMLLLGQHKGIDEFLKNNPDYLGQTHPSDIIKELIAVEAQTNPDFVQVPVDIMQITQDNIQWINRKD